MQTPRLGPWVTSQRSSGRVSWRYDAIRLHGLHIPGPLTLLLTQLSLLGWLGEPQSWASPSSPPPFRDSPFLPLPLSATGAESAIASHRHCQLLVPFVSWDKQTLSLEARGLGNVFFFFSQLAELGRTESVMKGHQAGCLTLNLGTLPVRIALTSSGIPENKQGHCQGQGRPGGVSPGICGFHPMHPCRVHLCACVSRGSSGLGSPRGELACSPC